MSNTDIDIKDFEGQTWYVDDSVLFYDDNDILKRRMCVPSYIFPAAEGTSYTSPTIEKSIRMTVKNGILIAVDEKRFKDSPWFREFMPSDALDFDGEVLMPIPRKQSFEAKNGWSFEVKIDVAIVDMSDPLTMALFINQFEKDNIRLIAKLDSKDTHYSDLEYAVRNCLRDSLTFQPERRNIIADQVLSTRDKMTPEFGR